jgi:hypothetical protein
LVEDFMVLAGLVTSIEMGADQPSSEEQRKQDELHEQF